ncbi:MAG TPA: insulinase family protein, partial [Candidatus Dormibacteraeota bacterium]|nr:insulinase family protein [Candidatus Dormibacteraeota bacterium]
VVALALAVVPFCAQAAGIAVPTPTLESAGGATIVRQSDDAASLVGVAVVVRAGLDRQTMKQNGLAALAAETILRTPVALRQAQTPSVSLRDAVAARGGSVRFTVDPSDVRFYVEALADDAPAVLGLFRSALASPDFSPATVREARSSLTRQIAASQQVALQVGLDMLNAASSSQANAGLPELGTPASLAQFFSGDVRAFYRAYYRRGGALVSAAGKLDVLAPDALASLAAALPDGSTAPVPVHVPALRGTTREIVAHRDISSPWLIAQYPAPKVDSNDFGPMLVLAAFVRRTLSDIAQVPGVVTPTFASRSVGAVYAYDRAPPSLVLYVNGGLIGNPSRAFATALSVVNVLAATRLQGSIDEFKAEAAGDFANGATTLETRTWLAAVFSRESASPDFINRALAAISATTPDDVQRVARTYLGNPTIALVLPRGTNLQD